MFSIVVFAIGSAIAITNPLLNSQPLASSFWQPSVAQASRDIKPENQAKEEDKNKFFEQLNLSSAQKQQIASVRQQYQPQIERLQNKAQIAQEELLTMMTGTDPVEEIRAKRQEAIEARQALGDARFESMLEMREVLTPPQRQQLAKILEGRRDNWRNNRSGDRNGKNWF
jgi:Spy/CpxP family protein refolding chaperone